MTSPKNDFCVISINYKKTALHIRNKFAFTSQQIQDIYTSPSLQNIQPFIILSTCNRTEIYTSQQHLPIAINTLTQHAQISLQQTQEYLTIKQHQDAIKHLFSVASGLDSQILGDYEIVGQLKNAFALSKKFNKLSGLAEKLYNSALECSKEIKNQTKISDGTTSVSFFAIQLIKQYIDQNNNAHHIVLLGLGKIGTNTLKNIRHYIPNIKVTVINRNEKKALSAHQQYNVEYAPFQQQSSTLKSASILIVATGAPQPIIYKKDIQNTPIKYIFDLSVPSNVHNDVKDLRNTKLINVDELSVFVNQTMKTRENELPKASAIIQNHYTKFNEWLQRRDFYTQKQKS